jgi:Holliday junction resolvase
MSINSKRKGKTGELEFARLCREHGYNVRRGQQYSGIEGQDVVGLPGVHVEVKRRERLDIYDAVGQATRDAESRGMGELPVVAWRRNNCGWLVIMRAEDWFELYREYHSDLMLKGRR